MNSRYIVKDKNQKYQAAYSLNFGKHKAYQWALQCLRNIKEGYIYFSEDDFKEEKLILKLESK